MNLHIYVGDGYSFFITCDQEQTVEKTRQTVETQLNYLFQSQTKYIELPGFFDDHFCDIPPHYKLKDLFVENSPLVCLICLTQENEEAMTVLQIWPNPHSSLLNAVSTQLSQQERMQLINQCPAPFPLTEPIPIPQPSSSAQKCQPYCQPLARFGDCQSVCHICGEVKSYIPTNDQLCTDFCKTTETRKTKSHGLDFCSICMSRYRNSKYPRGCVHQCKNCHRPWLLLNSDGICRSCHCLMVQNANAPFRQVYHRVPGSGDK
ncbi:Conserved_hypothetical protein [Hexamita inflata]|uniref:Uncharacterized protein n=1 Tax=Hexamita inflata TaxID=28002 RepID=A0AA86NYD4_9EUKA|nr:Conserved hypothetical protein [Hexamita inflata]CAI9928328.1 Conserved hypothetical protein [Hexamita inflata]CAI9943458.1 Conserved hypothetical protein [Hexamita inflata]CAI9973090.1 Conserved hypothetical protein [Hexamita inflata]